MLDKERCNNETMEQKVFKDVELFSKDKHIHVPLFNSERTKVLLLCLSGGLTVPPQSHPGFDITLQPLQGKAILPIDGGKEISLVAGQIFTWMAPFPSARTIRLRKTLRC